MALIDELNAEGATIVVITHEHEIAAALPAADRAPRRADRLRPSTRGGTETRTRCSAALAVAVALVASGAGAGARDAAPARRRTHPNELVLAGGSGQQAQLGKQFRRTCRSSSQTRTAARSPATSPATTSTSTRRQAVPSGIFAGSGSHEAVVGTNAQGIATAPTFTANFTAGSYTVDVHSDFGTVELSLSNTAAGLAASIARRRYSAGGRASTAGTTNRCRRGCSTPTATRCRGRRSASRSSPGATGAGASSSAAGSRAAPPTRTGSPRRRRSRPTRISRPLHARVASTDGARQSRSTASTTTPPRRRSAPVGSPRRARPSTAATPGR